jgi:hypothetical protein
MREMEEKDWISLALLIVLPSAPFI